MRRSHIAADCDAGMVVEEADWRVSVAKAVARRVAAPSLCAVRHDHNRKRDKQAKECLPIIDLRYVKERHASERECEKRYFRKNDNDVRDIPSTRQKTITMRKQTRRCKE